MPRWFVHPLWCWKLHNKCELLLTNLRGKTLHLAVEKQSWNQFIVLILSCLILENVTFRFESMGFLYVEHHLSRALWWLCCDLLVSFRDGSWVPEYSQTRLQPNPVLSHSAVSEITAHEKMPLWIISCLRVYWIEVLWQFNQIIQSVELNLEI